MKKTTKTSELMWILGILFVAAGVAVCSKSDLGVSMIAAPTFIITEFLNSLGLGVSTGVMEYILQGVLIIILCAVTREFHWHYILAFLAAVLYGYAMNLFLWLFSGPAPSTLPLRWLTLLIGDFLTATGVACFFRTYLPLQAFELFVSVFSAHFHKDINQVKKWFDRSLLLLSIVLALVLFRDVTAFDWSEIGGTSFHSLGLGTLVTTLINSPIIKYMGKLLDKLFNDTPLFPGLKRYLAAQK